MFWVFSDVGRALPFSASSVCCLFIITRTETGISSCISPLQSQLPVPTVVTFPRAPWVVRIAFPPPCWRIKFQPPQKTCRDRAQVGIITIISCFWNRSGISINLRLEIEKNPLHYVIIIYTYIFKFFKRGCTKPDTRGRSSFAKTRQKRGWFFFRAEARPGPRCQPRCPLCAAPWPP